MIGKCFGSGLTFYNDGLAVLQGEHFIHFIDVGEYFL